MNRAEYYDLRHRYRLAQRDDAKASTMNASEWKRGIHPDAAGAIRWRLPAGLAKTLEPRDATPCYVASDRLRHALGRFYGRRQRAASQRNRNSVLQQAMAQSRTIKGAQA